MVIMLFSIFRIEINSIFVAAILTIIGYSINNTIVIFDRIRELLKNANKKTNITELVNTAVSNTFVRTINTSITTLIMLIALVILGVASVKEFTIPLTVGVIVGAYSSSCLTSAAWYDMGGKKRGITEEMNKKAKEALEEAGKDAEGAQV